MIWAIYAAMLLVAGAIVLLPLFRARSAGDESQDGENQGGEALAVYRQQLVELERDLSLGLLNEEEAEAARLEIHRRMLAAADEGAGSSGTGLSPKVAAAVALLVLAAATVLYAERGEPGLVSLPLGRSAQADPQVDLGPAMGQIETRLAQLEAKLATDPDNLEGWSMLGRSYRVLGRTYAAADAYGRAVALAPGNVELRLVQAELLVELLDGLIGPAARLVFTQIQEIDPGHPAPRFYLGLAAYQDNNIRGAIEIWRGLEQDSPADAPWLPALRGRIARAEADLGIGQ
ncbi:MAG: c-type cytochrome biogenesis protein CcmI [Proteobacteria bacterium]|nr:c-type cytochrome biogenesis protein CcmI [Pseudomonadota bacterium]